MEDYYDLYLKTDVLLLADVFEVPINTCLEYYGLEPCCYFSSPVLSWDAMLKMTEIELELTSDFDMDLFIEKKWEEVFITLLKDLVLPIINTWNLMIIINQVNISCIWMQKIYMAG